MPGPRLLLVEDDRELSELLVVALTEEGYQVEPARDGQRGLHLGLTHEHDVLVIDRGLPAIEGLDLLIKLRKQGVRAPALLLTARGSVADRVEGLDAGAEDYLVKPFDLDELLARLRALVRRRGDDVLADVEVLPLGSGPAAGRLHVQQRVVVREADDPVVLSPTEAGLLEQLARRPTQVFTREELLDAVFDGADTPGVVDTYVHYLRRKLGRKVVVTVRGTGYRLGEA